MSKDVRIGESATNPVIKGIDTVADIVKTTIGPSGRNVLVRNQISPPIITNDGVTIAKSIQLKDNTEDAGAQLIIQAANKTNIVAGDGTTTTTVLAQEMIHKFNEYSSNDTNINAVVVQKDMLKASHEISDMLKDMASPVKDTKSLNRVATISSGSEEMGELIADAFETAGEYGYVTVEESKIGIDNLNSIPGMRLTNGSVNEYLLSDRVKQKTDMVDVHVLITTDKIDSVPALFKILDNVVSSGKKLLIICDDIEFEPLNMVINNKIQGRIPNIGIIRLPGFGQLREDLLNDICIATGATLMGRDQGTTLMDYEESFLGELEQVIINMDETILKFKNVSTEGYDLLSERQMRVNELTSTMENVTDDEKEQYKRRISNLVGGISVIEVGGNSPVEVEDKKLRIEDAINSVQAAKEEGIVPGGGFSFLSVLINIDKNREGTVGEKIVYDSLTAVTKQIAENAGFDGDEVLANCFNKELGFNALTGEYENLLETGVINSVKVDRYSLINATSVAASVITMGGSIVEENEKDQNILQLQAPIGSTLI